MTSGWLWELANRYDNRIPDPVVYVEMRRRTVGADLTRSVVRLRAGGRVPPAVRGTRLMRHLDGCVADFAGLYQKELKFEGEFHNGVLVAERFLDSGVGNGVEVVGDLGNTRVRQFEWRSSRILSARTTRWRSSFPMRTASSRRSTLATSPTDICRPEPAARARSARELLAWGNGLIEPALRQAVDRLAQPVRHLAGYQIGWWEADGSPAAGGGKGIRPALTLLCAEAVGGQAATAVPAAAAVELVHNFSLVHDDVMDRDEIRRHRPTVWRQFGVGNAILAGNALLALSVEVLAEAAPGTSKAVGGDLVVTLCACVQDLVEGQAADLAFERRSDVGLDECTAMASKKTGSLISSACALGASAALGTRAQVRHLAQFGADLGLAFQVADDLQGIWGDPGFTGKAVYSDLRNRKKSLPVVAALQSHTAAGEELGAWFAGEDEANDAIAAHVAGLVAAAGGRDWARDQLISLHRRAISHLVRAGVTDQGVAELTAISDLVHATGMAAAG